MIRFATMIALCVLCACSDGQLSAPADAAPPPAIEAASPAPTRAVPTDTAFVLPGTYSQRTTMAALEALFGKANMKVTETQDGEGDIDRSVVLFPDDPTRRAFVEFHHDLRDLRSIAVRDAGSRWSGKHGVRVGMSLADLQRLNGKAFLYSGFDSQQRGFVQDSWSPARDDDDLMLGKLDVHEPDHMYFGVGLGLRNRGKDNPAAAYPRDEHGTESDDPRYPNLGQLVVVTEINATTSLDDEWE